MPNLKGKLIIIDGGDGSGKQTQSELLHKALLERGAIVSYFDFPRYETLSGKLVGDALSHDKKLGDFAAMHPKLASLPYAIDRVAARDDLVKALEHGAALCNRYVPSNIGHQGGKFSDVEEQDAFIAWLEALEYGELKLPRPALTFFLHVPYEFSLELMRKQGRTLDQHEGNKEHLTAAINVYLRLGHMRGDWCVIECVRDGVLRDREDIHEEILRHVLALS